MLEFLMGILNSIVQPILKTYQLTFYLRGGKWCNLPLSNVFCAIYNLLSLLSDQPSRICFSLFPCFVLVDLFFSLRFPLVAGVALGVIGMQLCLTCLSPVAKGEIHQSLHNKITALTTTLCCQEELLLLLEGARDIGVRLVSPGMPLVSTLEAT